MIVSLAPAEGSLSYAKTHSVVVFSATLSPDLRLSKKVRAQSSLMLVVVALPATISTVVEFAGQEVRRAIVALASTQRAAGAGVAIVGEVGGRVGRGAAGMREGSRRRGSFSRVRGRGVVSLPSAEGSLTVMGSERGRRGRPRPGMRGKAHAGVFGIVAFAPTRAIMKRGAHGGRV